MPPSSGSTRWSTTSAPKRGADHLGDRRVVAVAAAGQHDVERGACHARGRHQAAARQLRQPGRHAEHQPRRQRAQPAARPHERVDGRGLDQLVAEAELAAQVGGPRHAGEERVGPRLDGHARQLVGADLPAGAVARLDDRRVEPVPRRQVVRGRQPGDATADDDDVDASAPVTRGDGRTDLPARTTSASVRGTRGRRWAWRCGRTGGRARRPGRGLDVEVVEDLEVVADEAARADEHAGRAGRGAVVEHLEDVGPEPRLGACGPRSATPCDHAREPGARRDRLGRGPQLLGVRVAGVEDARRQGVGGEHDLAAAGKRRRAPACTACRQQVEVAGRVPPVLDDVDAARRAPAYSPTLIAE